MSELMKMDEAYMMPTFVGIRLAALSKAEGCYVWDDQGKRYADFLAGIATVALGHCHPGVRAALIEQSGLLWHGSNYFVSGPQARLAQALTKATGYERAFFGNSGTEANEGAVKLARKYFYEKGEPRFGVITCSGSFHGRTLAMVAATAQPKYQKPYHPLPEGFVNVPYGDADVLRRAIGPATAAVMLEPMQGENGVIDPGEQYLREVRAICDQAGILLIFDEVQSGMGRTGRMLCQEHAGVRADITTLAKALGNGFPIGAILARESVAQAFKPGDHGTTFGGNALACAAACAVLKIMCDEQIPQRAARVGAAFLQRLTAIAAARPDVCVEARGRGLLLGLQLKAEVDGKAIVHRMMDRGFIINLAGNNTLRFVPPLVVPEELICEMTDALCACL